MNEQVSLFEQTEIPVTKSLTQRRNEAIRADYEDQTKKKHLDSSHVVGKLSEKYWLEQDTIWLIVLKQGYYKEV